MLLPLKSTILNVAGLSAKPLLTITINLSINQGSDVYSYDL